MADVFISYSKASADLTRKLASELEAHGLTVWWDTELVAGESYRKRIQQEIKASKVAIVIWTPQSVSSEYVISEAGRAHELGKLIQVRTPDVSIKDLPAPFDVSHVALIDDRKSIVGALRRLGALQGEAGPSEPKAWKQRLSTSPWQSRVVAGSAVLAVAIVGYFLTAGSKDLSSSPTATTDGPTASATAMSARFLHQLNSGLQDTSVFDTDVRLGQRGLMSRVEAANELRKIGAVYGKIDCKRDTPRIEMKTPEQGKSSFRAKLALLCDFTERGGKLVTKRFPLEFEAVNASDGMRISGLWQPEEMVLWQRSER